MDKVRKNDRKDWFFSYNMIFKLDVSAHAKLVYLYLCRCADSEAQCFPSKPVIAENCSISLTSVKNAIKELINIGLLKKEDRFRGDGSQTSNLYTIYSEPEIVQAEAKEDIVEIINKPEAKYDTTQSKYDPHPSECDSNPGQNTTPGRSKCDHQEVLPNIRTTQKEVLSKLRTTHLDNKSVCQSGEFGKDGLEKIKENCELDLFQDAKDKNMIENVLEILSVAKKDSSSNNAYSHFDYMNSKNSNLDLSMNNSTTSPYSYVKPQMKKYYDGKSNDNLSKLEEIKERCELHLFENDNIRNMLINSIDLMWLSEFIKVGSAKIPQSMVRSRMYMLHGAILFYALDKVKTRTGNTERISNSTRYLVSTIYNAINEYHSDAVVDPELNRMCNYI